MAKIDAQFEAIEDGFQNPEVRYGTAVVPDSQMEQLGLRRKKAGQDQHRVCYLSVGEVNQTPTVFWGHKFTDVLLKALEWRNLPTKSKRGRKAKAPVG